PFVAKSQAPGGAVVRDRITAMAHPAWANVLALLVAATTSPATTRPADDEPGWSEPVDGLQIRLVAEKTVIDARELPRLALVLCISARCACQTPCGQKTALSTTDHSTSITT